VDAFGINHKFTEGSIKSGRFMYQFYDTAGSYAHALQPLARILLGAISRGSHGTQISAFT
jgi:hypothetical protein